MKIKKLIQYSSLLFGTVLFVLAIRYTGFDNVIRGLRISSLGSFLWYLLISIMIFSGFVLRWKLILRCHGHDISFRRLFNYRVAGFAISYLTPSARLGGEPVRTYFLVKNKVPFQKAMSSVFIDKSLELTANSVMTLIGAFMVAIILTTSTQLKLMLFLVVCVTVAMMWLFYSRIFRAKGIFSSIIRETRLNKIGFFQKNFYKIRESELEMTNFFKNYRRVFVLSTVISFALWILTIFEYKFLMKAFGFTATFSQVFLVLIVVGAAYIVPIPTALGVLEGAQVSLFRLLGKNAYYGLSISIVTRVRDLMWTLYGLTYLYVKGVVVNNLLKDSKSSPDISERVVYFKKWKVKK